MSAKEQILFDDFIESIKEGSPLNEKYIEEKFSLLLGGKNQGEVQLNELRRAALVLLDSLFAEETDKH